MKQPRKATAKPMPQPQPMKNVTPPKDTTSAFLNELDAAMQQERLLNIWHTSKWFIVAAVLMLVLVVAGRQAWDAWQKHQSRTVAEQWYSYMQLNSDGARRKELTNLLETTTGGTRALAVYQQAAMQHTPEEKARAYNLLINDTSAPQWLRDIARLNAAIAVVGSNPAQAKAQLEILAQTNVEQLPSPAYAPALELLALIAQQSGDTAAARGYTQKLLQQPGLPSDMRQRALQRYGALGGIAG